MKQSTMTEPMIDLPGLIAKSDDTDFLKELIEEPQLREDATMPMTLITWT